MTPRPLPSIQFLKECLEISHDSPSGLRWKTRPRSHFRTSRGWMISCTRDSGRVAGNKSISGDGDPRFMVKICQIAYPVHRVVYALKYESDPFPLEVDHIDRNPLNNHPDNLRVANRSENARNKNEQANNTSGVKGVTFCRRTGKWMAQIGHLKKTVFLGRFSDISEARNARLNAEVLLHQSFSPNSHTQF